MFEGKKILITGGTGSIGQALTKRLLKSNASIIRVFSRNEDKQVSMESKIHDSRLRYLVGDIRDLPRISRALEDIDIVFHTAALKHVPVIEYNPFEAIKTNVIGSQNVIDASLQQNVETVVALGTDKAVSPFNTYGATKLLMEKLFVSASNYTNPEKYCTKFISLRYGNVLGSSGSVLPKFIEQIKNGEKITITDPNMTRISITIDEALDFIIESTLTGLGSEVFIPKLESYSIMDLKDALFELLGDTGVEIIGIRPGEKIREILINDDEIRYTWDIGNKYLLSNELNDKRITDGQYDFKLSRPKNMKLYSSDTADKFSKDKLKSLIKNSGLL